MATEETTAKKALKGRVIDPTWVFPRAALNRVINEYRNRSLKPPKPVEEIEIDEESEIKVPKQDFQSRLNQPRIQTPPLPQTPQPGAVTAGNMNVINPLSGLTRSETALLSPEEQIIARRT